MPGDIGNALSSSGRHTSVFPQKKLKFITNIQQYRKGEKKLQMQLFPTHIHCYMDLTYRNEVIFPDAFVFFPVTTRIMNLRSGGRKREISLD